MKEKLIWLLSMVTFLAVLTSCNLLGNGDPDPDPEPEPDYTYVEGLLDSLQADLEGSSNTLRASVALNNLTQAEVDAIIQAAWDKIESVDPDLLESDDVGVLLPLILEGAQASLSGVSSADSVTVKTSVIQTLVQSCVDIADVEVGVDAVGKQELIVAVVQTSVATIVEAGVDAEDIDEIASGALAVVVDAIDEVFEVEDLGDVINDITAGSVEAMAEAFNDVAVDVTADLIDGAIATLTDTVIDEIQNFDAFTDSTLGSTIVDLTSTVNGSLEAFVADLDVGITGVDIGELAGSVVSTVTNQIVSDDLGDSLINDVIADTITGMEGVAGITDLDALAKEITQSAVESAGGDTTVIYIIVVAVAEGVNSTTAAEDPTFVFDDTVIDTAITEAGEDPTAVDVDGALTEGETASTNIPPVISAMTISGTTFEVGAAGEITVTATASDADGDTLTFDWGLSPGIVVVSESVADNVATLVVEIPASDGHFFIDAIVSDGIREVFDYKDFMVTIPSSETTEEQVDRLVSAGILALAYENLDDALIFFEEAKTLDSTNVEAALFWSMLNMMAVTVDPVVKDLALSAGILGYPQTMKEFIMMDWTEGMDVLDGFDEYYDPATDSYIMEPDIIGMPAISVPAGYADINMMTKRDWDDGSSLEAAGTLNYGEYMMALNYNLQSSYPTGFNAPVTAVVNLLVGKLDDTIAVLNGLTANDSITLEPGMFMEGDFDPFHSIWPIEHDEVTGEPVMDEDGNYIPMPIVLGTAEVRLSMAALQMMASLLNSALSVDMTVDVATFWSAMNPVDGAFWGNDYLNRTETEWTNDLVEEAMNWSALPQYPMQSGFLQTSANAATVLAESETYFLSALGNMATAIDSLKLRDDTTSEFTFSLGGEAEPIWPDVMQVLLVAEVFVDELNASLTNDAVMFFPIDLFSGDMGTQLDFYGIASNWPTAADWTGVATINDPPTAIQVNPNILFNQPLIALDNLIELNDMGEPVIYDMSGTDPAPVTAFDAAALATAKTAEQMYAIKISDLMFGGIVDIPDATLTDVYLAEANSGLNSAFGYDPFTFALDDVSGDHSVYVQLIAPDAVFSALNTAGTPSGTDATAEDYFEAAGSFWYAMVPMIDDMIPEDDGNDSTGDAWYLSVDFDTEYEYIHEYDYDYYQFNGESGTEYTITVTPDTGFVMVAKILHPDGSELASSDDIGSAPMVYTPTSSGTYYIEVYAFNDGEEGEYSIAVTSNSGSATTDPGI